MDIDLENFADADSVQVGYNSAIDWTKYDGYRVIGTTGPTVYLIMNGLLYSIPDPTTYNLMFADWNGIVTSDYLVDNVPSGGALPSGSCIVVGTSSPAVYLVTLGYKMWVPDPATVVKFHFRNAISAPQLVITYVPTGPNVG